LSLLLIPSWRLFRNWQFVRRIKRNGLHKAGLEYRLFVQKVAAQIGIQKKVWLYVSDRVKSPVTFGYLKPIILLPVAALNHLSVAQVEAILLHELSHIKRYDYLVNLIISCIHTLLYFNPFVKLFIRNIESEREHCCDELVLQFGYDKVGYASALLTLEKASQQPVLAIAATGKNHLLNRIEKIVGMEKKNKGMKFNHLAGLIAALFCILMFNSIMIIKEENKKGSFLAYENFSNPFSFFQNDDLNARDHSVTPNPVQQQNMLARTGAENQTTISFNEVINTPVQPVEEARLMPENTLPEGFMAVSQDDVDASLSKEEKQEVSSTVDATKQLLKSQWSIVEETIGDAMDSKEKAIAKQQYLSEIEKINWKNVENNMKAGYQKIELEGLNATIQNALAIAQMDSIRKTYDIALGQVIKAKAKLNSKVNTTVSCTPLPDCSVEELAKAEMQLRKQSDSLRAARSRKVVRL
jgi:bla regulator protein blaR1